MKIALLTVPVFSLALVRFTVASLILFPFVKNKLKFEKKDIPLIILAGLFAVTLNISFFFFGIRLTSALNAGIIGAAIPIFTLLAAKFFLKDSLTFKLIFGGILGFLGIGIIIGKDLFTTGLSFSPLGDILILSATLCFVASEITGKKLSTKYNSFALTYVWFLIGAITFIPGAIYEYMQNPGWINNLQTSSFIGIFYGIFLSSLTAYSLWQWGLSKVPASRVGFFFYLDPVVSTIGAVLILSEKITWPFILGAFCVFMGIFIAEGRLPYHHAQEHIKENFKEK